MALLLPGLVSITFRALSPPQIIELAARADMRLIEWGGDVHVPAGDLVRAREVRRWSSDAGLSCAAYGSYYRLGSAEGASFEDVLATALALGAPAIRVWAGTKGSAGITAEERRSVLADAARAAALAAAQGVTLSLEYHSGTLTDTRASVRALLRELPEPGVAFLWQPVTGETRDENEERLRDVLPRLGHVHVFHWWPGIADRLPLAEGKDSWAWYLRLLRETRKPVPCLLEFVRNDSTDQFLQDAATLRHWLAAVE